jgi:hypothetical protein
MARRAFGRFKVEARIREESTAQGTGEAIVSVRHDQVYEAELAAGTADGQIDRVWSGALTVTTVQSLDLSGTLAGVVVGTVVLAELTGLVIRNKGTTNLLLGGQANQIPLFAATNDILVIPPGIHAMSFEGTGIPITAGTGDLLSFTAASGSIPVEIELWGRSA